jgi:hypothetical protein
MITGDSYIGSPANTVCPIKSQLIHGIFVARDRQWSVLSGFQRRNEPFNERLQQRRIHTMGCEPKNLRLTLPL